MGLVARRILAFGLAAVACAALGHSFHEAARNPPFASLLFGSPNVWRGHPSAWRVAAWCDGGPCGQSAVVARFVDPQGPRISRRSSQSPWARLTLQVPPDLAAEAWLEVEVTRPEGIDLLRVAVHACDRPQPLAAHVAPWTATARAAPSVAHGVLAYPLWGAWVGGLDNPLLLTAAGPAEASRAAPQCRGLHLDVGAPAGGPWRGRWRAEPGAPAPACRREGGPWQLLEPRVVARQLGLSVDPEAPWRPGQDVSVQLHTLPRLGPLHIDIWAGDALLAARLLEGPAALGPWGLSLPEDWQGPVWLAAYRSPLRPQDSLATALRWQGGTQDEAWAALARLEGAGQAELVRWAQEPQPARRAALWPAALSRVEAAAAAPLVASSVAARRAAFEGARHTARARAHAALAGAAGGTLLWAALEAAIHKRRLRRSLQALDLEGLAQTHEAGRLALLLAIVLGALWGAPELLWRLRWT